MAPASASCTTRPPTTVSSTRISAQPVGRHRQRVGGERDEVGELAGRERPLVGLGELGVGAPRRVGDERLGDRDLLLRNPAVGVLAVERPARHRRRDAGQRVERRDRPVGAEGETGAGVGERAEGIAAPDPLGTQPVAGPAPVVGEVDRLHRGDDAEPAEAGDLLAAQVLGVLDAEAAVARPVGGGHLGEEVEQHGVGALADGVHRDLETLAVGGGDPAFEAPRREPIVGEQPDRAGGVGVGFEEVGGGRAERAVHVGLEAAEAEPVVAAPGGADAVALALPGGDRRPRVEPHGELAAVARPLERGQLLPLRDVLHRGDAHPRRLGERRGERRVVLRVREGRDLGAHQRHGGVLEDAGRLAGRRVADDLAPGRVGGLLGDAGERQRARVGEAHVAVEPVEEDRHVAGGGVDPVAAGERRAGPDLVVPGAEVEPAPRRHLRGRRADPSRELLGRRRVAQVETEQREAAGDEVGVGVDEAGHDAAAAEIEHAGAGPDPGRDLGRRSRPRRGARRPPRARPPRAAPASPVQIAAWRTTRSAAGRDGACARSRARPPARSPRSATTVRMETSLVELFLAVAWKLRTRAC